MQLYLQRVQPFIGLIGVQYNKVCSLSDGRGVRIANRVDPRRSMNQQVYEMRKKSHELLVTYCKHVIAHVQGRLQLTSVQNPIVKAYRATSEALQKHNGIH